MDAELSMRGDFRLGDWHVQPALCRLSQNGRTVQVRPKVMDLLVFLARAQGAVISKETLLNEVWRTEAVSESALTRTVTELRQALGDSVESPHILETIPKRGYRLIADVSDGQPSPPPAATVPARTRLSLTYALILALLSALVTTGVLFSSGAFGKRAGVLTAGIEGRPFAARDWVLVAPFLNRTGDPAFDEVVELALERELVNSKFVNVVPRPRIEDVLALMKRPAETRLDDALAREVAVRDGGIRALLTGRIDRVGAAYVLTASIVDPADGRTLATISHNAAQSSDLLATIRTQAFDVRQALGESIANIERSREALAKVTTPSLKALQLYSRAASLLNGEVWRYRPDAKSRYATAEALLTEATALDPTFASAWLLLAHSMSQRDGSTVAYIAVAERAMQLSSGVSDVERCFIEGYTHSQRGRNQEDPSEEQAAARAFEAVLQLSPDHYWALLELVPVYRQLGRFADAERLIIHQADVRPRSPRFALEAARVHLRRGERAQARAMIERARAVAREDNSAVSPIDLESIRFWEANEAWVDNDPDRVLAAARRAEQETTDRDSEVWLVKLAYIYGGIGRYDDALRVAKRMPSIRYRWTRDYLNLQRGRIAELRELVQPERHDFDLLNVRLMIIAWAGWLDDAEWVLAERRRRALHFPWFSDADTIGQIRIEEGRYGEGLAMLERLKPSLNGPRYYVVEHIAMARRGLGDSDAAIRELERAGETRAEPVSHEGWGVYGWLRCRVLLAEMYRDAGRHADAERVALEVRNLLSLADDGNPLVARALKVSQSETLARKTAER